MNKLTKIQKEVKEKFLLDSYIATLEMIEKAKWGIEFFQTQEAKDLHGEEMAKKEILIHKEALRIKKVESAFYEALLNKNG